MMRSGAQDLHVTHEFENTGSSFLNKHSQEKRACTRHAHGQQDNLGQPEGSHQRPPPGAAGGPRPRVDVGLQPAVHEPRLLMPPPVAGKEEAPTTDGAQRGIQGCVCTHNLLVPEKCSRPQKEGGAAGGAAGGAERRVCCFQYRRTFCS